MTPMIFVLASSSPRRLELLGNLGIVPDKIVAADIDERNQPGEVPAAMAERLAMEKLTHVAATEPGAFVLAADTVVAVGRRVLPKAATPDDVKQFLHLLSGRRHHVFTGVALRAPSGKIAHRLNDSIVTFRQLSEQDIDDYVKCGEGIGKAGGYAVQGRAAALIRKMSGSYSGVVGLPLFEVAQMMRGLGWKA